MLFIIFLFTIIINNIPRADQARGDEQKTILLAYAKVLFKKYTYNIYAQKTTDSANCIALYIAAQIQMYSSQMNIKRSVLMIHKIIYIIISLFFFLG